MKNISEVFGIFQKFHVVVERETNELLKCLRTDNGGEYCSDAFKEYCNRFGIKHEKTMPGTAQQNGDAERMNCSIMEKMQSMLSNSSLEKNFWVEPVRTACYLINRSPTTALVGGIPEEVWTGKKLNYSHLKIFGFEAFVHIPKENRTKLDDKSMKHIFLGYADEDFGYRLWDPVKHKIIRCRDVIFNESEMFKRTIEASKVEHGKEWKKAMEEEMNSLQESKTWELLNLPKGRKALQNKWVYKIKHEGDEKKERYKARLVVKGFAQKEGIDFTEIFSHVVKMSSIRVILGLVATLDLECE
eukprot:PITA_04835